MKRRALTAATIIALVGLLAPACGAPAPEGIEPRYTNDAWGLSMWYPDDWTHQESEFGGVVFASSEQLFTGQESESGASMFVVAVPVGRAPGTEGVCDQLVMHFGAAFLEDPEASDPQPRTIGGQDGCAITFESKLWGEKGFAAVTVCEGWLYLFQGGSSLDEWSQHGPELEAMLDSVQFTAPARPTPASTG